jgi:hypothetical protein
VNQRKDRCVGSDSQRQGQYHCQAENRVPAHRTQCIAHVLANRFDRRYRPPFPILLFHSFHTPKATHCGMVGFGPAHSGSQVVFGLHLQMKANFVIQFAIQSAPHEQTPKPYGKHPGPTH